MPFRARVVRSLEEALKLAPALDRHAAEFMTQFSDEAYPAGASARFLRRRFGDSETVLVTAAEERGEPLGMCLVGPLEDPLLESRLPLVLVLYVDSAVRHRGLAGLLVEAASRELADRGIPRLAARAGHNDDALISMGERWGFTRLWELMLRE